MLYKHRYKFRYFTFFKYKKHVYKIAEGHVKYTQLRKVLGKSHAFKCKTKY